MKAGLSITRVPQFPREGPWPMPPNWLLAYAINHLMPSDLPDDPFDPTAWLNPNSGSVAAVALGRRAYAAELDENFAALARERLALASDAYRESRAKGVPA